MNCPNCMGSKWLDCWRCGGKGRLSKRFWIFGERPRCPECLGSGGQDCRCGSGKVAARCRLCDGGRLKGCVKCGSTGKVLCPACGGTGKAHSDWFTSLSDLTIEQLRAERETRRDLAAKGQHEIRSLGSEIDRLTLRLCEVGQQTTDGSGRERCPSKSEGDTPADANHLRHAIDELESRLAAARDRKSEATNEVVAIQKVVRSKTRGRPCRCGGSNENCRYCYGSGRIA
jgi:uncharacterized Zn finger protein (UPF0148 family)